jgi:hypothetical protein
VLVTYHLIEAALKGKSLEEVRGHLEEWESGAARILDRIFVNLGGIDAVEANWFNEWMTKYQVLETFCKMARQVILDKEAAESYQVEKEADGG